MRTTTSTAASLSSRQMSMTRTITTPKDHPYCSQTTLSPLSIPFSCPNTPNIPHLRKPAQARSAWITQVSLCLSYPLRKERIPTDHLTIRARLPPPMASDYTTLGMGHADPGSSPSWMQQGSTHPQSHPHIVVSMFQTLGRTTLRHR